MEVSHDIAPPIELHKSMPTSIQEPAPPSDVAAASEASDSDSTLIHKPIGTTELCEQILGYLSCTELCRTKRVCQRFRDVIDHSAMLQKNLFLRPSTEAFPEGSLTSDVPWHVLYNFHTLVVSNALPNPRPDFEIQLRPVRKRDPNDHLVFYYAGPCPTLNHFIQTFDNISGVSNRSSLRKMYFSNPPVKEVLMCIKISYRNTPEQCGKGKKTSRLPASSCVTILSSDQGITFGHVFEYAEEFVEAQIMRALSDEYFHPLC
ncbi:hypothetical protein Q7P36_008202 [Cladosporium allicinum]